LFTLLLYVLCFIFFLNKINDRNDNEIIIITETSPI
jgi:hypothetical protein